MVFVCVIWSFDDMGLGEQVILSDKKSKGDKENSYIVHFSDSAMVSRADARGYGTDIDLNN